MKPFSHVAIASGVAVSPPAAAIALAAVITPMNACWAKPPVLASAGA